VIEYDGGMDNDKIRTVHLYRFSCRLTIKY